jgi:hypothetical protein
MLIVPCQTCLQEFLVQIGGPYKYKGDGSTVSISVGGPDLDNLACNKTSSELLCCLSIGVRVLGLSGEAEWHDEKEGFDGSTTEYFVSFGILF